MYDSGKLIKGVVISPLGELEENISYMYSYCCCKRQYDVLK